MGKFRYGRRVTQPRPLSRRTVVRGGVTLVALGAASVLTACAADDKRSGTTAGHAEAGSAGPSDESDVDLVTLAVQDETQLLALAAATVRRHRPLAPLVQPVVSRQRAHVSVLSDSLTEPPNVKRGRPPKVPASEQAALTLLRNRVAAAEQDRSADCLDATSGLLARLLASTAASHATTVEILRGTR